MKTKLLITFILLSGIIVNAQSWQWAKGVACLSANFGNSIASDSLGNFYFTGFFRQTATFGTITLIGDANGDPEIFVAKINSSGQWQWAVSAGGPHNDIANAIFTDASGNSYITGTFTNAATFGSYNIINLATNSFIAKINSSGQWQWAIGTPGISNDITVDNSGNSYITGLINGPSYFGSTTLNSNVTSPDAFVAKLDPNQQWVWAVASHGTGNKFGKSISIDNVGNLYISGEFTDTTVFGIDTLSGGTSVFISKLNSTAQWQWARQADNYYNPSGCWCHGNDLLVDKSGNTYITGIFDGIIVFGADTVIGPASQNHSFIAKMSALGQWSWVYTPGGMFETDGGKAMCKDNSGNIYFTGFFEDHLTFGSTTLTNLSTLGLFVAKMDSTDQWLWAQKAEGNDQFFEAMGIAVGQYGDACVTGFFNGTVNFGSVPLTGGDDAFIAKLGYPLGIAEKNLLSNISLYPNPFSAFTEIYSEKNLKSATFTLYNSKGQLVKQIENISGQKIILKRENLPSGLYLIRLTEDDKFLATQKFVITD